MGSTLSSPVPPDSPLGCLLKNLKSLKLTPDLRPSKLIHLCNKVWIQYPLDKGLKWPPNGTLDLIILKGLHTYCQQSGKWKEVPYIQTFIYFRSNTSMCSACSPPQVLLAMKRRPVSMPPKTQTAASVFSHQDTSESINSTSQALPSPTGQNNHPHGPREYFLNSELTVLNRPSF